jgi:lipopolysaccharide export system permease protein
MEQNLNEKTGVFDSRYYHKRLETIDIQPEDLRKIVKNSEEMNLLELKEYIAQVENEGYEATIYRVDFHAKIAYPFICLIMCIIGTGISFRKNMKEGIPVGVAYGIAVAFLYWILYSFCMSLGYAGMLPPPLAAWIANIVFISAGIAVFIFLD